jgi:hypothetical protein
MREMSVVTTRRDSSRQVCSHRARERAAIAIRGRPGSFTRCSNLNLSSCASLGVEVAARLFKSSNLPTRMGSTDGTPFASQSGATLPGAADLELFRPCSIGRAGARQYGFFCRPFRSCKGFLGITQRDCCAKKGVAILALRGKGWLPVLWRKKCPLPLLSVL